MYNLAAYESSLLQSNDDLKYIHNKNNQEILCYLQEFNTANSLTGKEYIITGSSCGSMMNYFILGSVKDVDVCFIDCVGAEKTQNIDCIRNLLVPDGYKDRLEEKYGFLFLSQRDLLFASSVAALAKLKRRDMVYTKLMLKNLNISVDDYLAEVETLLNAYTFLKDETKEIIKNNMKFVKAKLHI